MWFVAKRTIHEVLKFEVAAQNINFKQFHFIANY